MNTQNEFDRLKNQFSLKDADFYFLDLIPLIKVIWADGRNQKGELKILYKFVTEHISYLDQQAGLQFVTIEQANDSIRRCDLLGSLRNKYYDLLSGEGSNRDHATVTELFRRPLITVPQLMKILQQL